MKPVKPQRPIARLVAGFLLLAAALLVAGITCGACSRTPPPASPSGGWGMCKGGPCYSTPTCDGVRRKFRVAGAIAIGGAALTGGGALTTAFPDNGDTRIVIGAISVGAAVATAVASWLRGDLAEEFADYCARIPEVPEAVEPGGLP